MIAKVENKIITVNGKILGVRVKSLTFTVDGVKFPTNSIQDACSFSFTSEGENSVEVSYGDGTFENIIFGNHSGNIYRVGYTLYGVPTTDIPSQCLVQPHVYEDGYSGQRSVTFTFQNPELITGIVSSQVRLFGYFPLEIGSFKNLKTLTVIWARFLINMPESIAECKELRELTFQYNTVDRLMAIPDAFFDLKNLTRLSMAGSLDLSDIISSNFFKINQLKNLIVLNFGNCLITELPSEIMELKETLTQLRLINNTPPVPFEYINTLYKLSILQLQAPTNKQFQDLTNLQKVGILQLGGDWDFTTIGINWAGFYNLHTIANLDAIFTDNAKSNEFVNNFYDLVVSNASIVPNGSAAPYPNRFRNIAWGSADLIFTGAKVAPPNYQQGISNGDPTTPGHKVYILQNQYGHTITHGEPL